METDRRRSAGGVLAVSTAVSAFAAAAEEEQVDTTLPEGITQELLDEAVVNMDANAINLLGMAGLDWDSLVSNKTVGEFIGTVNTLLTSIDTSGIGGGLGVNIKLNTRELWAAFDRLPENPFDEYFDLDVTEIPLTELDYGVANGDVDAFVAAIKDIFKSNLVVLITALGVAGADATGGAAPTEPTPGMLSTMLGVSLPEPLHRFAFYPIFEDLGLEALTPDEASAAYLEMIMSGQTTTDDNLLQKAYDAAVQAKADGSADLEELKAEYLEMAASNISMFGQMLDIFYGPIFDLVGQVLKAPLTSIVNLLPKLDAMIQSGEYGWLFDLLGNFLPDVFPADAAPASLVDLLNSVLANVQVNGATLGLTLPAFDFAALDELSMADRTMATINYLAAALTTEENIEALTVAIPAAGAILGGMDADTLKAFVVNYLATGQLGIPVDPEEPSTDPGTEDPGESDTEEPGTEATDPEEPGDVEEPDDTEPAPQAPSDTQPQDSDTTTPAGEGGEESEPNSAPDTGDAVLGLVALAAVATGGVIAFTRRKK
ncbi:MAG: hypothetical protein ACLU8W_05240 [Clostridia bacterium]